MRREIGIIRLHLKRLEFDPQAVADRVEAARLNDVS
jgi:hypothetical protein